MIETYVRIFGSKPKKNVTSPLEKGYHPEFEKRIVRRELRSLYDNIRLSDPSADSGCNINEEILFVVILCFRWT